MIQPQALYGLGGIGKTQTATEYAYRYGDEYTHVLWMRAASRETLVADFVTLAELLDLAEKAEQDQQRVVAAVKRWLANHEGWLLILDNADDLPLAREFLPTSHKGYILLTTRAQAAGAIAASVEVEQLDLHDGTLLLLRRAKLLDIHTPLDQALEADRVAAERIVGKMGGLPLAIVQAGAYVEETGCSLEDYLRLYETHHTDLLAQRSNLLLDYPDTVATTWALSFQQIEQESPAAADVLRLCAFLAPDAIPEELLTRGAAELGALPGAEVGDQLKLNDALKVLRRYSLVRRGGSTHLLNIHRLVQVVLRESMDQEARHTWAKRTVLVVNAAFPDTDSSIDANQQYYLPHAQECATLIKEYHLDFPEAAHLLFQAGAALYSHGFYSQSRTFHEQALSVREEVCGPEHSAVAESFNRLAMLARVQGDNEKAERLHWQALTIREKVLGPHDLATAESLNNLGVLYRAQGKYEQAEPLLQRAISIRKQALGPEHVKTLLIVSNLGKLYVEQRKYEQAEELLQQTQMGFERILEPGHPLIAQNLGLLARLAYEQGNHEQAEHLWKQALAILEKALGLEHYALAKDLNNLAKLYLGQGRHADAQSLWKRAFDICEKALGPEHPETITYRERLERGS